MSKLAQSVQAAVDEIAEEQPTEGESMTKKINAKKPKREKKPKAEKKVKAVADGPITGIKASGETYLQLAFGDAHITLTPTSNRQKNRNLVVEAIRALLK